MKRFELKPGDLIMSCSGTMGKIAIAPNKLRVGIINQALLKLTPNKNLDTKFLKYWMKSTNFQNSIKKYSKGVAIKNIASVKILKQIEVPLPPLPEQIRIVKILDEVFSKIELAKKNTEKNLQNSKELFESYLQNIFEKGGDNWEEKKIEEIAKIEKNKNNRNNLPYVGMEDIESNSGKFLGSKKIKNVKSSTFHFSSGHILYGRLRPYLNKILIPNFEGHCSTEIFPIKTSKAININFLFYWFLQQSTVEKINKTCTGTRMPRANMKKVFKNFTIKFPKSLATQKQIVIELDALSEKTKNLEDIYQQKIDDLDELKKSVLQKAFAGEL